MSVNGNDFYQLLYYFNRSSLFIFNYVTIYYLIFEIINDFNRHSGSIILITNVKTSAMRRLEVTTGADIVTNIDQLKVSTKCKYNPSDYDATI